MRWVLGAAIKINNMDNSVFSQVDVMQDILHLMKAKLAFAKEETASQLHQYHYLLQQKARSSDSTRGRHQRPDNIAEPLGDSNNIRDHPIVQSGDADTQGTKVDTVTFTTSDHKVSPVDNMDPQLIEVPKDKGEKQSSVMMHSAAQARLGYVTER